MNCLLGLPVRMQKSTNVLRSKSEDSKVIGKAPRIEGLPLGHCDRRQVANSCHLIVSIKFLFPAASAIVWGGNINILEIYVVTAVEILLMKRFFKVSDLDVKQNYGS